MRKAIQELDRAHGRRRAWLRFRRRNRGSWGASWPRASKVPSARKLSKVTIWEGDDNEEAICLTKPALPPSPLCFDRKRDESVKLFESFRKAAETSFGEFSPYVLRPDGKLPRILGYFDFSKIEDISTAAAVVLAAEYQRITDLSGFIPPTVNLDKWPDGVFLRLYDLGFFEIVGLTNTERSAVEDHGDTRTMRIVSSRSADDLQLIDESLQALGQFLGPNTNLTDEILISFITAISEAISNVTAHAYDPAIPLPYPHIGSVWVAATADRARNTLTIVVYDQGTTIPATYPRLDRKRAVARFLARAIRGSDQDPDYVNDGTFIRAAMRYGGSRTDKPHRGRGLPQMFEVLKRLRRGRMIVLSRGGWCSRDTETGRMQSGYLNHSIGGTLIEWSVSLSDGQWRNDD